MMQFSGSIQKYPARVSVIAYSLLIIAGAVLLQLPASQGVEEKPIGMLDAVFTSTSATCVTGLAVRSTEHDSRSGASW